MFFSNLNEKQLQTGILSLLWLEYAWELYLSIRQYRLEKATVEVPKEFEKVMTKETFEKARLYNLDKDRFSFVRDAFSMVVTTFIIYGEVLALIWNFSESINPWMGEVSTSCIWLFILSTITTVTNLPFKIYYTFVLEEKYGFNKQTVKFFILDQMKSYILGQILTLSVSSLIIVIVKYGGDWFFVWLWLVLCVIILLFVMIYPSLIAPLFDKYTPLPEGQLRTNIENLASELKFPLAQLYVVEGSKRSAHSNAYFYGLFKTKRIVLFDTLLANPDSGGCQDDEVLAVISHELGHWKHNHVNKNIVIMQVNLFLMFVLFSLTFKYPLIYKAVGFYNKQPVLVGLLVVLQYIMTPYNAILSFLLTCLSRKFEFEADDFAFKLNRADPLIRALVQINKDNLGFPVHDPLFSAWHHSHPPLLQRITVLKNKMHTKHD